MKKVGNTAAVLLIIGLIAFLILNATEAKEGAKNGIELCGEIIIPSLLPVLIMTNVIVKSNCSNVINYLFSILFEKVFKLDRVCCSAVILGLVGGYPSGALLTLSLYENGSINSQTAKRIMRFNFCGGIAFIITALGTVCRKSTQFGVALYFINVLSSLIICATTSFFEKEKPKPFEIISEKLSYSDALIESVESTVKSLAVMSVCIIFFSALINTANITQQFYSLIEITAGVCSSTDIPFEYCAFFLSFGGLCIHFQLLPILKKMNINYGDFFIFRVISAIVSFFTAKIFLAVFPSSAEVFGNVSSEMLVKASSSTLSFSLVLVLGCAVIIFDIENKKLKLI